MNKNFLGINWKVRAKKKSFWVALLSTILAFANGIAATVGHDIVSMTTEVELTIMAILGMLVVMGVITDDTTKGLSDSPQAQEYDHPRGHDEPIPSVPPTKKK